MTSAQLPSAWAACASIRARAEKASQGDGALARLWTADLKRAARR